MLYKAQYLPKVVSIIHYRTASNGKQKILMLLKIDRDSLLLSRIGIIILVQSSEEVASDGIAVLSLL